MIERPPSSAIVLTAAGVLPFIAGAALSLAGSGDEARAGGSYPVFVGRDGTDILVVYGLVIFSYMSGCFWGFAAKATAPRPVVPFGVAVIPALYGFFYVGLYLMGSAAEPNALLNLILGFLGLLAFDFWFQKIGLAPKWWMTLRVPVTGVVVLCLSIGLLGLTS